MYKRFLNTNDYKSIVTEEALRQLIRDDETRIYEAEEAAESTIVEYLTQKYEVEKTLAVGKNLLPYNTQITYPAGAHFYYNGQIHHALRLINGTKRPCASPYWEELLDFDYDKKMPEIKAYSQALTYSPNDLVSFSGRVYKCIEYNGQEFKDIRIPGVTAWQQVGVNEWESGTYYDEWDVVSYEDVFYTLLTTEGINWTKNPYDSDCWGQIGEYDETNAYEISETDYAVYDGNVYYPLMNVNADALELNYNIALHDPRNSSLKRHMLHLAVYELHKLISPNNISSSRITDYEMSIEWLRDAAKQRLDPTIPRKRDEEKKPVSDFAVATFMRDYDPYKNIWQI